LFATSHGGALLMASSRFARYLSGLQKYTGVATGLVMANTNCGEISPPRKRLAGSSFRRQQINSREKTLMPQRTENRGRTHPRTSEGCGKMARTRGKHTHAHTHTHTHTHTRIHTRIRPGYPKENNTHRSFYPRVYFSEDFSSEDCFQRIIPEDRSFFLVQIARCLREIPMRYLKR